jgi:hypothetical protein
MSYGEIIKAAFWITLRNRYLCFVGFFAGGTSAGANSNIPRGALAVSTARILRLRDEAVSEVRHPSRVPTPANGYSTTLP